MNFYLTLINKNSKTQSISMAKIFKTFEDEWWLIIAAILLLIPFNPTNIFVDEAMAYPIESFIAFSGVWVWITYMIPWVLKAFLAVAETELLIYGWNVFFPKGFS